MGLDNISDYNGFMIAALGMSVVFVALVFIACFIHVLPKVLTALELAQPPAHESVAVNTPDAVNEDEQIAAAIAYALHQRDA